MTDHVQPDPDTDTDLDDPAPVDSDQDALPLAGTDEDELGEDDYPKPT